MKKNSYSIPVSDLAGVKTLVTNDSSKGIPADTVIPTGEKENKNSPKKSEPRERALPETQSRSKDKGRDPSETKFHVGPVYKKDKNQGTSMDQVKIKPRTLSKPGGEYGNPSKNDYGTPTRRTMTGTGQIRFAPKKRQKKQRGTQKLKSRRNYRRNKNRNRLKARLRFKRNKSKSWFKKNQQIRQKNPARFKRRVGEVLMSPEIAFSIGREHELGYVRGLSPMTGMVQFLVKGKSHTLSSLPLEVFLCAVVFLSEDDIEAMYNLIEVELGDRAFKGLTYEAIRASAEFHGVDIDVDFESRCQDVVGVTRLEDMSEDQLFAVDDAILDGVTPKPRTQNNEETENMEEAKYQIDPTDDDYYYGEVAFPPRLASVQRVALSQKIADRHLKRAFGDQSERVYRQIQMGDVSAVDDLITIIKRSPDEFSIQQLEKLAQVSTEIEIQLSKGLMGQTSLGWEIWKRTMGHPEIAALLTKIGKGLLTVAGFYEVEVAHVFDRDVLKSVHFQSPSSRDDGRIFVVALTLGLNQKKKLPYVYVTYGSARESFRGEAWANATMYPDKKSYVYGNSIFRGNVVEFLHSLRDNGHLQKTLQDIRTSLY